MTRETTTNHRATVSIHTAIVQCRLWEEDGIFQRGKLRFTDVDDDLPLDDYWEQLTSEELRRTVTRKGNVETEQLRWVKVSRTRANEYRDCLVYAEAGRLYLGAGLPPPVVAGHRPGPGRPDAGQRAAARARSSHGCRR